MKYITPYRLLVASLAIVYMAFGLPKIFGISSVEDLIQASFPFFDKNIIALLGVSEVMLGFLLLYKKTRSLAAIAVILHLLGTFGATVLNINYFFSSRTIFTLEGEFVFKNIVFISLAVYIIHIENKLKDFFKR